MQQKFSYSFTYKMEEIYFILYFFYMGNEALSTYKFILLCAIFPNMKSVVWGVGLGGVWGGCECGVCGEYGVVCVCGGGGVRACGGGCAWCGGGCCGGDDFPFSILLCGCLGLGASGSLGGNHSGLETTNYQSKTQLLHCPRPFGITASIRGYILKIK